MVRDWPGWHTVQFEQLSAPAPEKDMPVTQLLHTLFVVAEQAELRYLPAVQVGPQAVQGAKPVAENVPAAQGVATTQAPCVTFHM